MVIYVKLYEWAFTIVSSSEVCHDLTIVLKDCPSFETNNKMQSFCFLQGIAVSQRWAKQDQKLIKQ